MRARIRRLEKRNSTPSCFGVAVIMLLDCDNVEEEKNRKLAELTRQGCRMDETLVLVVVPDPRPAGEIPDELLGN